jgi:hypothetical protein
MDHLRHHPIKSNMTPKKQMHQERGTCTWHFGPGTWSLALAKRRDEVRASMVAR